MSAKHTPGPWEACIGTGCHAVIASVAGEPKAVAIVGNSTPKDGLEPIRFANARLIAAAPNLLEALQYVLEVCPPINQEGEDAQRQANAAIAKATGETK